MSISKIVDKHFRVASQNFKFKNSFPQRPIVAYRKQKTIGDRLIRAKLHPTPRPGARTRHQSRGAKPNGFKKCQRFGWGCELCHYSEPSTTHKSTATGENFPILSEITCTDNFVCYDIICKKCNLEHPGDNDSYVGKTTDSIASRASAHRSDTRTGKKKAIPEHFNGPGHSLSDMVFLPFEKISNKDETLLASREEFWIRKKQAYEKGINRQK